MNVFKGQAPITSNILYSHEGLRALDVLFSQYLTGCDSHLAAKLGHARSSHAKLTHHEQSQIILELAPYLEEFLAKLFNVTDELDDLKAADASIKVLIEAKRLFIQRYALKKHTITDVEKLDPQVLEIKVAELLQSAFDEDIFAKAALESLSSQDEVSLGILSQYGVWATLTPEGKRKHKGSVLFSAPQKVDYDHILHTMMVVLKGGAAAHLTPHPTRPRHGFHLTDPGATTAAALSEAHYCIWCHQQDKDSCRKGMKDKNEGGFVRNPSGIQLTGCPVEEKISEMNWLRAKGFILGAFATAVVDNPMVAATGYHICNDCMKSCIYQKQTPVNIPAIESRILEDVLSLPWGFEIYSLLTRWNPLNFDRPLPKASTGANVLIAGMGPAGFTLAHHLLNDGHAVVGVEGLKLEPLPETISGVSMEGTRVAFQLVQNVQDLYEPLDDRIVWGFGGVAEYGITARWNKNYLKLIRLLLERREHFRMYGGIRMGGTITIDQAFEMGFDHVALCLGAGKPTIVPMANNLAKGVRQASDFLMALQLTGAAKMNSIANLQVRMPVVVIGGGLTAVDTATEALAYYPRQVLKFAARYHELCHYTSQIAVESDWTQEDRQIAEKMLAHAKLIQHELEQAQFEKREADFLPLLKSWGGAKILYRRRMNVSPSVTLNHEEVEKALEEGIEFVENVTPLRVIVDEYGAATGIDCKIDEGDEITFPAGTVLVAAGTIPNIALALEDGNLVVQGKSFQAIDKYGAPIFPEKVCKPQEPMIFCHSRSDGRRVSFLGDLHPSYAGNVVRAMGSAKQSYPYISRYLQEVSLQGISSEEMFKKLDSGFKCTVKSIVPLTANIVELTLHAPFAARQFKPGQFFRLQNFERLAPTFHNTTFAMEGLALTGASADPETGEVSTIILEMGGSSDLCRLLKPGENVVLMGPTGTPTDLPSNKNVLLIGGGLGNAVLFSIAKGLKERGSKVLYFAGYKTSADLFKREEIEKYCDKVVWCCDVNPVIPTTRPQDQTYLGNIVEAMRDYASQDQELNFKHISHAIVIGSDGMMAAVQNALKASLKEHFPPNLQGVASVNSPMQCMMKEICGQCLQKHRDPQTGEETFVFSCVNQDQNIFNVDFRCLRDRLSQNHLQECLTQKWIEYCLSQKAPAS
ncbi:MAG: FAD-dependent oxidoreductase [Alphaproteobacteria bacterium]|nr:FAD-dependent oxidoreductase [Alphaproteobacteria bacterium]OJV46490.1 MAG: pyridine nucleotide-disulfide oxidoreductase [Alphaproteobacteria bacterium 43-37]